MPGISAGMFQKDSYVLWLMHGWFAGYVAPRAVSLTACRLWLSAVAQPVPIVICRPGLAALLWRAHRFIGTRLDLWCFDLRLRYQRWRRLLEGIVFVGNFVGLAGLLLSPARQGRCGRMWSPCVFGSCRFFRCRLCRRQSSPTFLLIEKLVELQMVLSAKTVEFPQLQYFEKVVDVHAAVHRCSSLTRWLMCSCCSSSGSSSWFHDGAVGLCTQVHGQGLPRHQGGEGVAGTPGACSQVFCHPN